MERIVHYSLKTQDSCLMCSPVYSDSTSKVSNGLSLLYPENENENMLRANRNRTLQAMTRNV